MWFVGLWLDRRRCWLVVGAHVRVQLPGRGEAELAEGALPYWHEVSSGRGTMVAIGRCVESAAPSAIPAESRRSIRRAPALITIAM